MEKTNTLKADQVQLESVSPATRLLEKRRMMYEVQEAYEAQKEEYKKYAMRINTAKERRRIQKARNETTPEGPRPAGPHDQVQQVPAGQRAHKEKGRGENPKRNSCTRRKEG